MNAQATSRRRARATLRDLRLARLGRKGRPYKLREAARLTGISAGFLSRCERGLKIMEDPKLFVLGTLYDVSLPKMRAAQARSLALARNGKRPGQT